MKKVLLFAFLFVCSLGTFAQSVQDTVHLNAVASDTDGSVVSYQWAQVSGPTCTIAGANNMKAIISFTSAGHYIFQCTVTDNKGKTVMAQSTGDVLPANLPPTLRIVPGVFNIQLSK